MGGAPYHKKGRPVFFQNVNGEYVMYMYVAIRLGSVVPSVRSHRTKALPPMQSGHTVNFVS